MCLKMWIGRFIRGYWGRLGEERWDLQIFLQITPLDLMFQFSTMPYVRDETKKSGKFPLFLSSLIETAGVVSLSSSV